MACPMIGQIENTYEILQRWLIICSTLELLNTAVGHVDKLQTTQK